MHEDIKAVLISEEQIQKRVQELGEQLSREYAGKRVIIICLLKGAAYFACDLSRAMSIPVRMEFMVASSYGDGTTTSGSVAVRLDVKDDIAGMHVLLVDDIIDTGLTFARVKTLLETKKPASINTVPDIFMLTYEFEFLYIHLLDIDIPVSVILAALGIRMGSYIIASAVIIKEKARIYSVCPFDVMRLGIRALGFV